MYWRRKRFNYWCVGEEKRFFFFGGGSHHYLGACSVQSEICNVAIFCVIQMGGKKWLLLDQSIHSVVEMLALQGTFGTTRNFSLLIILEIEFLRFSNIFLI
jgi:hypothetical protein